MGLDNEIMDRLVKELAPTHLEVINESHMHAGHAGDDGSGESHWRVKIKSDAFSDMSRLQRHRAVHTAIGADLMGRIHALALEIG